MASAYSVSLAMVGGFTAVLFATHTAVQLPAGRMTDALGPRHMGVVAAAILIGSNALALAAPEPAPEPIDSLGDALPLESFFEKLRGKVAREQEARAREQLDREKS